MMGIFVVIFVFASLAMLAGAIMGAMQSRQEEERLRSCGKHTAERRDVDSEIIEDAARLGRDLRRTTYRRN